MENPFENMKVLASVISLVMACLFTKAQNYHAIQGSSWAGSLGIANNPATMLSNPIKWDVTLVGVQFKSTSNIFTIHDYSLLSNAANSTYSIKEGDFRRKGRLSFNTNILNARITLDRRQAIGFGANFRTYLNVKSSPYNYIDTISGTRDFFNLNDPSRGLEASVTGSSFAELFGSYSRTIIDNAFGRLNAGITVKVSRGLAAAYVNANHLRFRKETQLENVFIDAQAQYGYSANIDKWQDDRSTNDNLRDLVAYSDGGIGVDIGVEYLLKPQAVLSYDDEDDYYDYDWKFGLSILDIGANQYRYGRESRNIRGIGTDISDIGLEDKFRDANSVGEANDSLATIVESMSTPSGKFTVLNPTRMVLNADRFLVNNFYINGELSLNLSGIFDKYHRVSEINLLTITPRWETRTLGAYLPIQVNSAGRFWIGGAFKAGPLLLGVHNWANLFGKKSFPNGGGYIAIVIRAWNTNGDKSDRRLNCPD